MAKAEEMERMREHVFNEVDLNRGRLISWEEFKRMSEQPDFEKDEGWKTIDQNEINTNEELKQFEHQRQQQIDQMIQNGQIPQYLLEYYQHHPDIPKPSLNHGPLYQVNPNYHQPQQIGYPQEPYVGQPQNNQFAYQQQMNQQQQQFQQQHPQNQQLPQYQQSQYQQPQHQQPQHQQPQQNQQRQPLQPKQINSQNANPQQSAQTEQKSKDPQLQQPKGQSPPLQNYAPEQQQYQTVNSDSIKKQNIGRLNDVNSNQMLKNQKENFGKTVHINKN